MHLPRCCERAAEATGTRLRQLRSGPVQETPAAVLLGTMGKAPPQRPLATSQARGPSTRINKGFIPAAAAEEPVRQQEQQEQHASSSKPAVASPGLTKRRSGGAALGRQPSSSGAAAAAVAAAAAATAAAAAASSAAAARKICRKDRGVSSPEKASPEAFSFPETNDPVDHVARTYPGGPQAFAAALKAERSRASRHGLLLLLLLLLLAAAATTAFLTMREPSLLLRQQRPQQQQQQEQQPLEGNGAAATAAAATARGGMMQGEEPIGLDALVVLPGMPLQKQHTAAWEWEPPSAAALSGLTLNVLQPAQLQALTQQGDSDATNPLLLWARRRPRCQAATTAATAAAPAASAAGLVAVDTPEGSPLLRITRPLLLSSADAPPFVKDNCLLQQTSRERSQQRQQQQQRRACYAEELLAVLLVKEMLLLRELQDENPAAAAAAATGCLLNSSRRNAPYFGPYLWKAISLVLPQQGQQQLQLQQQLLQLAKGPLAGFIGGATKEDVQLAVSLVHARSVWDGEKHVAISALDELQEYHWSADLATQHETTPEGLVWRAPRDMRKGDKMYVNYGQYNNAYLLLHFGVETESNPWGPAFFWRADAGELPHAALPNGVSALPVLRSSAGASSLLPAWLQETAVIPASEPCHPPLPQKPCPVPHTNLKEPVIDRVSAARTVMASGEAAIVCDLRVFTLRAFGKGAFVLSDFGAVGGVDSTVYRCVRALRFGGITDSVASENRTTGFFFAACKAHHAQLTQAEYILKGGLAATEARLPLLQRGPPSAELEGVLLEVERLKAMQRAVAKNKGFAERCFIYFREIRDALKQTHN
ncbi:hypothetical protein Esti_003720 [Eimeria stiedai]